jgi:DNA modification methylase
MLTNEEKRVIIYSETEPTKPESVSSKTPLNSLNLNWRESDLPERVRTKHVHRLHPYLGKYIPQLVEIFLRKYFKSGETVLDPFVGSGTTLVQANELGINSIGFDISVFNTIICKAKTTKYDLEKAKKEILDILNKVTEKPQVQKKQLTLWEKQGLYHTGYLNKWFAEKALEELLAYRSLIEKEEYEYQDLLKVILSRSARSARLTTHFDLDFPKKPQTEPYWCYKHSRTCTPTQDAMKFLHRYSHDTIKRIEEYSRKQTDAWIKIEHGDSRKVKLPQIDGVITSPPYVGLIDYHEQHAYAYELLGLENNSGNEIGSASSGTSQRAKEQYVNDISSVFKNAMTSMASGQRLIVVAGDRSNLYEQIAEKAGVKVEDVLTRHVNRRTGRRAGEFYESIFIWQKP